MHAYAMMLSKDFAQKGWTIIPVLVPKKTQYFFAECFRVTAIRRSSSKLVNKALITSFAIAVKKPINRPLTEIEQLHRLCNPNLFLMNLCYDF
jgi:hypothetical protein